MSDTAKPERKPSPRAEARKRRDEALMALGRAVYTHWRDNDRETSLATAAIDDAIEAVDNACADVALQS